jgi:Flp pilus assembly protein TadG
MRRGAVSVEMAVIAPVVALLIFGSIEFARLNILQHAVNNAAYEAARHGMVPGATAAEVTTHAQQHLNAAGLVGATIQVTPTSLSEAAEQITVEVAVPMDQNSWIVPSFSGGQLIEGACTLRTERYRGI